MLSTVREFFSQRNVLEVETPTLYPSANPEPMIEGFQLPNLNADRVGLHLQTSPEFAMKRLLAAGSGAIFQICRAYRKNESGRHHNPEFTILEWYRPGFSLRELMSEVEALLLRVLPEWSIQHNTVFLSYQTVFQETTGLNPLTATIQDFISVAIKFGCSEAEEICADNRSAWLDFLFSHVVQSRLPKQCIVFVYNYPACQAALARLHPQHPEVAERVEVFIDGVELGNGFQELTDAVQQRQRFIQQQAERKQHGMVVPELDEFFLNALESGIPECAGIAIGLDRLLMKICNINKIQHVLTFSL